MELTRDLMLDQESRMLVRSVAEFREQVIDGSAREMDEFPSSGVIEKAWKSAASLGLVSALLGEGSGGQGMDIYSFCLALTEVARGCAGFAALLLVHNLALWALEAASQEADEALTGGEARVTMAWPVKEAGGTARAEFVPGLTGAAACVLPLAGGGLCRVAPGCEGVTIEGIEAPMGLRASRPASLVVESAGGAVVGDLNGKRDELEGCLLLGIAALSLGLARHAFEGAREYARERYQAGDYIINHQQIRLMLAGMVVGIEAGDASLRQAATAGGCALHLPASRAAKVLACDRAVSATLDGIQVHGGYGYMRDYGMEVLLRDAKYCQSYPRSPQEEMLDLVKPAD
ncbi:MAG: acyl-CoA dehydrogenase family protein [Actinobacteria bacterium]|nr:acyl-CoA dehydrogenase family protein [Actinomycetota bacterium]MBU4302646.1 acyl-CoA dehydrogenase family protein [Actinomycetota bacterium]MBU4490196.1 acyl-CoA dehydrogenase family protein [Actinomycetota bacterium]MCG2795985.1 acyl-CoA dehydrogenase family protein [Actinomycetes bacterium]